MICPSRTLHGLLQAQAASRPDSPAVLAAETATSYEQLWHLARSFCGAFVAAGIRRGERIGLLMPNQVEWIAALVGASLAGAVTVPMSTWSTSRELEFLVDDSRIRLLVAASRFADRDFTEDLARAAAKGLQVWTLDQAREQIRGSGTAVDPHRPAAAADVALVLYTSGSTSVPKAVPLVQEALVENGFHIGERQGLGPQDRVLLASPLFWAFGAANALMAAFTHGAALVLLEKFNARQAIDAVERHACTAIYTLPAMTHAILAEPTFDRNRLASLRTGVTIGSKEDFLLAVQALGVPQLCNIYGSTETYGNCTVTPHDWPLEKRAVSQGQPLPGQEIRIVPEDGGQPVAAAGQEGLVEVRGRITPGYDGASAAQNGATFTADGFYRTGDLGVLEADGSFRFVARRSEMIKKAGINISPSEVEDVLQRHPAVAQAAVVGTSDANRGELVHAFVVLKEAASCATEDLLAHCRILVSKYKVPDRIDLCPSLPLTVTGKLHRQALRQRASGKAAP